MASFSLRTAKIVGGPTDFGKSGRRVEYPLSGTFASECQQCTQNGERGAVGFNRACGALSASTMYFRRSQLMRVGLRRLLVPDQRSAADQCHRLDERVADHRDLDDAGEDSGGIGEA